MCKTLFSVRRECPRISWCPSALYSVNATCGTPQTSQVIRWFVHSVLLTRCSCITLGCVVASKRVSGTHVTGYTEKRYYVKCLRDILLYHTRARIMEVLIGNLHVLSFSCAVRRCAAVPYHHAPTRPTMRHSWPSERTVAYRGPFIETLAQRAEASSTLSSLFSVQESRPAGSVPTMSI